LTGYELKQRADATLRFYWVSPAMSQVYTELARLSEHGLVKARDEPGGGRRTRRYGITVKGRRDLTRWLQTAPVGFPALKHPVALRLLLGHLVDAESTRRLLEEYLEALAVRRDELQRVHDSLDDRAGTADDPFRFPRMVSDWGLEYYQAERETIEKLLARLSER
ncbi:MAG: helix-turn-helix transcriptional regulator, partial [Nocardioidaceae bacterium]